jgi:hypothetical protein
VSVVSRGTSWSYILIDGRYGYVYNRYLR